MSDEEPEWQMRVHTQVIWQKLKSNVMVDLWSRFVCQFPEFVSALMKTITFLAEEYRTVEKPANYQSIYAEIE